MTKTLLDQFPDCVVSLAIIFSGGLPDAARAAAEGTQQRAEEDEEEGEEDTDGESTEDVDQHVRVAALPEDSTQHLCRVVPEAERRRDGVGQSRKKNKTSRAWST